MDKFECMLCHVENSNIIESSEVKLLGIKIDSKPTFDSHMDMICKKASQKLNALLDYMAFYHSIDGRC